MVRRQLRVPDFENHHLSRSIKKIPGSNQLCNKQLKINIYFYVDIDC
jgi:hypothetical protein